MGKFSKQLCHCEERLWTLLGNFITELLDQRNDDWCASICENITFHGLETTQQQQQQQQLYLYTTLVKYLLLLSKFLTQKFCYFCKEGVFLRLKPGQSVSAELLIMLFKVVPHVTTFDETMVYDHSVESYWVVLSCYCQLFVHHFLKTSHGCLFSLRGSSCVCLMTQSTVTPSAAGYGKVIETPVFITVPLTYMLTAQMHFIGSDAG